MDDPRRAEARRLRVDPGLSLGELMKHFGVGSATLTDWLRGIAPPEWTRRPNAKDDLRKEAVELRTQGWSVNDLAAKLGVAKSTAYAWVSTFRWILTPNGQPRSRHMLLSCTLLDGTGTDGNVIVDSAKCMTRLPSASAI